MRGIQAMTHQSQPIATSFKHVILIVYHLKLVLIKYLGTVKDPENYNEVKEKGSFFKMQKKSYYSNNRE